MSNNKKTDASVSELLNNHLEKILEVAKKSNKHAAKRNRLAKRKHRQSVLNYEQAERQYLIEKSRLQPTFSLSVTEFLACDPDFFNDPEPASEAKYIASLGVVVDEQVLRIKVHVKGEAEYLQPSLVIKKAGADVQDERVDSMSKLLYFAPMSDIHIDEHTHSIDVYFVYFDITTLPVIHKYQLTKQKKSALQRWDVVHLDTIYATSDKQLSLLNSAAGCAALFTHRIKN